MQYHLTIEASSPLIVPVKRATITHVMIELHLVKQDETSFQSVKEPRVAANLPASNSKSEVE